MSTSWAGKHVVIVEDEFYLMDELHQACTKAGAVIVGAAATIAASLDLIRNASRIDLALLDIDLHGEQAYSVADALIARGVPFAFTTGYDGSTVPERYREIALVQKPIDLTAVADCLFA